MAMPDWWTTRRLGMFVHASAATVPAWAPIGQYAAWYRSHLGEPLDDVGAHPSPLVEVLAHHHERWGHIDHYDDFVPLLHFDHFDAEEWARLADDAGAGYSVLVAKHHDGWSWWDAPNSARRLTDVGPGRNVLAEYAAACERHDIVFGTYYSLLDWGDVRYPGEHYVSDVLHRDVTDLVQRFGSRFLWGDGHWGHDAGHWRSAELAAAVRRLDPDVVFNDRWWLSSAEVPEAAPDIVRTFEYDTPDGIVEGPWELCRAIGHSFGHNRTERSEHHLTGLEIVDLYTEVLAKGGNLLLDVGPSADGTIPDLQSAPLREAGDWIRRHDAALASSRPWDVWGDASTRYLRTDDTTLHLVDLAGTGRFGALSSAAVRVVAVERLDGAPVDFEFGSHGLVLPDADRRAARRRADDGIGVDVYRVVVDAVDRPVELFEPSAPRSTPLAPLLADAVAGDIVRLGDGVYDGPADVPAGVVLRGLGAGRTVVRSRREGIAPVPPAITVGPGARVEHLSVEEPDAVPRSVPSVVVDLVGGRASMFGCRIGGHARVLGDDVVLRAVVGRGIVAENADRLSISRCSFAGNRWDVGILLLGGGGQCIESCELEDHLCAIRASGTTGTEVRHNTVSARWWAVHLENTEDAHVHGNRVRTTMRAVAVDGGTNATVDGNAVDGGDSGCVVERGASATTVRGNHWERCRIGLLAWGAGAVEHHDNICVDLHDPDGAVTIGP